MRRIIFSGFLMLLSCGLFAQRQFQSYLDYIEKYKSLAIKEQYRHGIPASITMAQAIIESNAGESMIAVKGKNHFGIKCGGNWSGKTIYKDDDKRHDCFRSYSDVLDSYEDHSQFLKRDRYASLFKIPVKDYKAWARELKRLGYATDPNYANKLIKKTTGSTNLYTPTTAPTTTATGQIYCRRAARTPTTILRIPIIIQHNVIVITMIISCMQRQPTTAESATASNEMPICIRWHVPCTRRI